LFSYLLWDMHEKYWSIKDQVAELPKHFRVHVFGEDFIEPE
jgi:hypothetical protein